MKKLLFLLVLVPLVGAACSNQAQVSSNSSSQSQANTAAEAQGRAVFSVTDAAPTIQGVTAVNVTIDKVEVHSTAGAWVTVTTATKTFDLFQLKQHAKTELLTDANLSVGTYDQVRLHVASVMVTSNGTQAEAKLPSNDLKIVGQLVVTSGADASVALDFKLDKSLHLTGSGTFILTPVIQLDSRSGAQVQVGSDDSVKVNGGQVEANVTVGEDENGEVKPDFVLGADAKLDVTADGVIHVLGSTNSAVQASTKVVTYSDSGFSPAVLTIKVGTTVKFKNTASDAVRVASNPHPLHTDYPTIGGCVGSTFDSCQNIAPGASWSFTFDQVGTWGYHNHLNPSETGTIVVQP